MVYSVSATVLDPTKILTRKFSQLATYATASI